MNLLNTSARVVHCCLFFFLLLFLNCSRPSQSGNVNNLRIVSFAPSITETLYALGLGDNVVGVTRYCSYPPEVKKKPQVGGYLDPNYELILQLKPTLVIVLKEHSALISFLTKENIPWKAINNENCEGICESFSTIAAACNVQSRGDSLASAVCGTFTNDTATHSRPRVLFCIGRDNPGSGTLGKLFIAGPKTFYNELLVKAGAENAYTDSTFAYPSLSTEGVITLAPDIIIDCMGSMAKVDTNRIMNDWRALTMVPAVASQSLYCLTEDYVTIPGPRILLIYQQLRKIVLAYQNKNALSNSNNSRM